MKQLTCNECKTAYTEEIDIKSAESMKKSYLELCKKDNYTPKGIAPCPNMMCAGELVLSIV